MPGRASKPPQPNSACTAHPSGSQRIGLCTWVKGVDLLAAQQRGVNMLHQNCICLCFWGRGIPDEAGMPRHHRGVSHTHTRLGPMCSFRATNPGLAAGPHTQPTGAAQQVRQCTTSQPAAGFQGPDQHSQRRWYWGLISTATAEVMLWLDQHSLPLGKAQAGDPGNPYDGIVRTRAALPDTRSRRRHQKQRLACTHGQQQLPCSVGLPWCGCSPITASRGAQQQRTPTTPWQQRRPLLLDGTPPARRPC